jgi:alginate O-acetyltransferase complex protein AlgI
MITFLASGFWHGASWNYVLWGAYHGLLLIIAKAAGAIYSPPPPIRRRMRALQVVAMFVLTCVGWLIFRETELAQLIADLRLSPADATPLGQSTGVYLFMLVMLYSLPLWLHDLWAELKAPDLVEEIERPRLEVRWPRAAAQAALCGVLFAAILVLRSQSTLNFIYFAF